MLNTPKNICSGCGACYNVCPVSAIKMLKDDEGFLSPVVDDKKCIDCNLCNKVCYTQSGAKLYEKEADVYACWADVANVRKESSSGGVFSLLAEFILAENGIVCGAAFNEQFKLEHIIISDKEDISKLRGSKYLQSDIGDVFKQIKTFLDEKRNVLFTGTPCQIAGLKNFLQKDYTNLFCADLLCHAVPSPEVWDVYINQLLDADEKIEAILFRDKKHGWKDFSLVVKTNKRELCETHRQNIFMQGFLNDLYCRSSCSSCYFAKMQRVGDITLGDFWAVDKKFDDNKGTSLILINSSRGEFLFDKIKKKLVIFKSSMKNAKKGNYILSRSSKPHKYRSVFFSDFKRQNFDFAKTTRDILENKKAVGIMNFWWSCNYGAILTAYALQETLKNMGYFNKHIFFRSEYFWKEWKNSVFEYFAEKYLNTTKLITNMNGLSELNQEFGTFIVGSDQMWRHSYTNFFADTSYFLDFARDDKKLIACAVSFGNDKYEGDVRNVEKVKYLLKRFDAISLREDDGVDVCKKTFNQDAEWILDPVFMVDSKLWDDLIVKSKIEIPEKYLAYNVLDMNDKIKSAIPDIIDMDCVDVIQDNKTKVEDWLSYIKNSDFFITDSFHGVCFALIFQKQFICLANQARGLSRFKSLLGFCGLENRILFELNQVDVEILMNQKIDYAKINEKLSAFRIKSLEFLARHLDAEKEIKSKSYEMFLIEQLQEKIDFLSKSVLKPLLLKYKFLWKLSLGKKRRKYKQKYKDLRKMFNIK